LEQRLEEHETDYERWINSDCTEHYVSSFEILKYGKYSIELLEEAKYNSFEELLKQEGMYQIKNYIKLVNTLIAGGRPKNKIIDTSEIYKCYCGKKLQNKWKIRYKHVHTCLHKSLTKQKHLEFIKINPKFEVQSEILI
jgi:hypothetical protein